VRSPFGGPPIGPNARSLRNFPMQANGAAAALSGDTLMMEAYRSGDPYLAFAKQAGAAPADATKVTHKAIRDQRSAVEDVEILWDRRPQPQGSVISPPMTFASAPSAGSSSGS
jgi:hypothetical protein